MDADFQEFEGGDAVDAGERRDLAMAIKACLDSLRTDARAHAFDDLDRFLELASLAAAEAAASVDHEAMTRRVHFSRAVGNC